MEGNLNRNDAVEEDSDSDGSLLVPAEMKTISNTPKTHSSTGTEKKPYACKQCEQSFNHASNLSRHKKSIHEGKCFVCDQCYKRFTQLCHLKTHKNVVHERVVGTQVCQLCGKCFQNASILKRHLLSHTGERPYLCDHDQCNKTFTQMSDLSKHKKSVHEGIRPYMCQVCGKRFFYINDLKKHQYTHTGERPFPCNSCERSFTQLTNLKNHIKVIHQGNRSTSRTAEKPHHKCDLCGKSFKRSSNFEIHKKKAHQGLRTNGCDLCGEQFTSTAALKKHLNIHTWPAVVC